MILFSSPYAGLAALLYSELKNMAESILALNGTSDEEVAQLLEEETFPSGRRTGGKRENGDVAVTFMLG
jgi:hypothetical protein